MGSEDRGVELPQLSPLKMAGAPRHSLDPDQRDEIRRWLDNWNAIAPLLERERRERVAALTDQTAWHEAQAILEAWQPDMPGDAGEGLLLQQDVFARWRRDVR